MSDSPAAMPGVLQHHGRVDVTHLARKGIEIIVFMDLHNSAYRQIDFAETEYRFPSRERSILMMAEPVVCCRLRRVGGAIARVG